MIKKSVMKKAASKKAPEKKTPAKKAVKKAAAKKAVKTKAVEPTMQILQTAKCKTVSGKSDLTYNIALDDGEQAMIRIASNSGGGFWSKEYVYVSAIINAIESVPEGQSLTSVHLFKVFTGKSQNSPGFLLAVLLTEGLLEASGKKRQYRANDAGIDKFLAKIDKLKSGKS